MVQKNVDSDSEWIFCQAIKGKCSGLNPNTKVLEKIPKTIKVHGKEVKGWIVKIVREKSEVHIKLSSASYSDE